MRIGSGTKQVRDKMHWRRSYNKKTVSKLYVMCPVAPFPVTLNDLEDDFGSF